MSDRLIHDGMRLVVYPNNGEQMWDASLADVVRFIEGERIEWCKTHDTKTEGVPCIVWRLAWIAGSPDEKKRPTCKVVPALIVEVDDE